MHNRQTWDHAFHLTVPDHWKNDPQRPIYIDGEYHYYYLYNADYPQPRGTAWRRVTTTDGIHFIDRGVALPKHTQPNGDLWSGSLVIDETGTAGLGEGAVIALVTQPDRVGGDGAQAQFLWYSTDGGATFSHLADTPVLPNPGKEDFRDPKLLREGDRWLCVLAEGHDLGIYTSDDLRSWSELSRFHEDRLGTLECPDLFRMTSTDGSTRWVLAASPNVSDEDRPGTYAYWTGEFDGTTFHPDNRVPQWLDYGYDWYAAVTWPTVDAYGTERDDQRWAIGWMNNWAYANTTPTWNASDESGYNGIDSVVRELTLDRTDDGYLLRSRPVLALDGPGETITRSPEIKAAPTAYRLTATLQAPTAGAAGFRVKVSADGSDFVEVGVSAGEVYIDRSRLAGTGVSRLSRARAPWSGRPGDETELEVLVDRGTVEVFADGGRLALSMQAFTPDGDTGLSVFGPTEAVRHARMWRLDASAEAAVLS